MVSHKLFTNCFSYLTLVSEIYTDLFNSSLFTKMALCYSTVWICNNLCLFLTLNFFSFFKFTQLFQKVREKDRNRDLSSTNSLPQIAARTTAEQDWSQEPRIPCRSPTWVAGPRVLRPSSAAFSDTLSGTVAGIKQQDISQCSYGTTASQVWKNPLCCNIRHYFFKKQLQGQHSGIAH